MTSTPSFIRNLGKVSKTYRDSGIYGRFINAARLDAWRFALARFDPPRDRIVDVGCAYGSWAENWRGLGFKSVVGIDPNPEVIADARAAMDEAHLGFASDLAKFFPQSHLCAANGVVVHILEDAHTVNFLSSIADTLVEGGLLIYSVLNADYYYNAGRKEWFGPNSCVRTLETQRRFAAEAGLEILAEIGSFIDPWALRETEWIAGDAALRERPEMYQTFIDLANVCRGRSESPFSEMLFVTRRRG
jgi:SAM-dependent methyltransferase